LIVEDYEMRPHEPEEFEDAPPSPELEVSVEDRPEVPRVVFSTESASRQVALQPDLLQFSWYNTDEQSYPHYGNVKQRFFDTLRAWQALVDESRLGPLRWSQVELSYYNVLDGQQGEDFSRIARLVRMIPESASAPEVEDLHYSQHTALEGIGGQKARIHAYLYADFIDKAPRATLALNYRGLLPATVTPDGLGEYFDHGHETLLETFIEITTPEAHVLWGRELSQ
jgi:uncharacterized protein (TIGR04255 family)